MPAQGQEHHYCDPEWEYCEMASWDRQTDMWNMEYEAKDGDFAVLVYGLTALVNVALPAILWWVWQEGGDRLEKYSAFWYTWYIGTLTHISLWGGILIMWPLTYLDVDVINYAFIMWASLISVAAISIYWVIIGGLSVSLYVYNPLEAMTSKMEQWITLGVYALFAGLTGATQLMFLYLLMNWYYVNPYLEGAYDMEMMEEVEEEEEIDDNGY